LPETLDVDRPAVPAAIEPSVVFSQVCGYPLQTIFHGQAILLGTPCYAAFGCDGPTHTGIFVVRRDAPYQTVADLAGIRFVFNSIHSNSGMNLPRRTIADIAGGHSFFGSVRETDGHPRNLDRLIAGEADATCVDCVTYALCCRHRPVVAQETRVLATTAPSPSLPFVTSVATPPRIVHALRAALKRVGSAPDYRGLRDDLMLAAIVPPDQAAYSRLLDYERESVALGYPRLI